MSKLKSKWFNDIKNSKTMYSVTPDGRLYKVDEFGNVRLVGREKKK